MANHRRRGNHVPSERVASERSLGITERTSPVDFSWQGEMRKRYTDFIVFEVRKDGTIIRLHDYAEPEARKQTPNEPVHDAVDDGAVGDTTPGDRQEDNSPVVSHIDEADRNILEQYFGSEAVANLVALDQAIQAKTIDNKSPPLRLGTVTDRQKRGAIHQEIRRIFSSRIETSTDNQGNITAMPFKPMSSSNWRGQSQGQGRRNDNRSSQNSGRRDNFPQPRRGENYLHLTLYKENKDTMDAVNLIARMLKIKSNSFGFSGTKDRRAATVQRVSIHHQRIQNVLWLNTRLPGVKLGDFKYSKHPVQLGQHGGNEFVIVLKNVEHARGADCSTDVRLKLIRQAVHMGLRHIDENGFINYFGLQRFGTQHIGTHELGIRILQGDYEGAVNNILYVDPDLAHASQGIGSSHHQPVQQNGQNSRVDEEHLARARALALWFMTKNSTSALDILPKRFSAEISIITHLGMDGQQRDYKGALLQITRGLRTMYIHAYQSYVWNHVASYRWKKYGTRVVEGDLILLDTQPIVQSGCEDDDIPDVNGEWEEFYAHVQPLTAKDIASGKYTIFDIVLPQPGYDVIYPPNDVGEYYKTFMRSEAGGRLDPYEMRRSQKEFSMNGGYRHFIGRFATKPEYLVRTYSDDNEQMYPTDLDLLKQKKADESMAKKLQQEAKAPSVANWNDFAQNAEAYDAAQDAEVKRRRDEEPSPAAFRVNETWVETSNDGSLKRAKIAQHSNTEVHANDVETKTDTEEDLIDLSSPAVFPAVLPANPSVNEMTSQDQLLKRFQETARELSSSQASHSATPVATATPTYGEKSSAGAGVIDHSSTTTPAQIAVPKPKLESIDGDITTKFSPANYVYDDKLDGDKIAVILKFQLRASSYATIVTRELMSTLDGEYKSLTD